MPNVGRSIVYRYPDNQGTLYLNITNRCTNNCTFCIKEFALGLAGYILWLDEEPTDKEILAEVERMMYPNEKEVVWCGFGEPTMRLNTVLRITKELKRRYPGTKIRLNTDGLAQLRNPERDVPKELKDVGIDAVSISLNAENSEKYNELCRPAFENAYPAILNFIRECKRYFEVRVSVVRGTGADMGACKRIADQLGVGFLER